MSLLQEKPRRPVGRPRSCDGFIDTHIAIPTVLLQWAKADKREGLSDKLRRLLKEEYERVHGRHAEQR